ncbi:EexN family lipoprotein [Acidithiobacillus caldus]
MKFQKTIPILLFSVQGLAGCGHNGPAYHDESYYKNHPKQEKKVEEYCQKHHDLSQSEKNNCQAAHKAKTEEEAEKGSTAIAEGMFGNSTPVHSNVPASILNNVK